MNFNEVKMIFRDYFIPYGNWWFYPLGAIWWTAIIIILMVMPGLLSATIAAMEHQTGQVFDLEAPLFRLTGDLLNITGYATMAFAGFLTGSLVPDLLRAFWRPKAKPLDNRSV